MRHSDHIDDLLRIAPEDIVQFLVARRRCGKSCWQNQTGNNELLEKAVIDFRKAYALIRKLPNDKFYRLQGPARAIRED